MNERRRPVIRGDRQLRPSPAISKRESRDFLPQHDLRGAQKKGRPQRPSPAALKSGKGEGGLGGGHALASMGLK
jgi:hypothetical protein